MEKSAFIIYLVLLVLSPLLFGAVHTYAYSLMTIGVLVATLLLLFSSIKKDFKTDQYHVHLPASAANPIILLIICLLIFQVIPLPESLVRFLSPQSMVVWEKSIPASSIVDSGFPSSGWLSMSSYCYPIRLSFLRWIA